jgi:hypothetical protein
MQLRGTLSYFSDGAWTSVRPGGAVFLPWGCLRTYRNDRDQTSRRWVVTTLSGFERFFARCADQFGGAGRGMERIVGIATEQGIEIQALPSV